MTVSQHGVDTYSEPDVYFWLTNCTDAVLLSHRVGILCLLVMISLPLFMLELYFCRECVRGGMQAGELQVVGWRKGTAAGSQSPSPELCVVSSESQLMEILYL